MNKALYFVLIETRFKKAIKLKIFLNNITTVKSHYLLMFIAWHKGHVIIYFVHEFGIYFVTFIVFDYKTSNVIFLPWYNNINSFNVILTSRVVL